MVIGLAWYAICSVALVRLSSDWPDHKLPVMRFAALMLAKGGANLFQFRLERLDLALFFLFAYWLLLAVSSRAAARRNGSAVPWSALMRPTTLYAVAWGCRLWQMNRTRL